MNGDDDHDDQASAEASSCNSCRRGGDIQLLKCSRCKTVMYCSADCQKRDWKAHKPSCKDPNVEIPPPRIATTSRGAATPPTAVSRKTKVPPSPMFMGGDGDDMDMDFLNNMSDAELQQFMQMNGMSMDGDMNPMMATVGGGGGSQMEEKKGPRVKLVTEDHPLHKACKDGDVAKVTALTSEASLAELNRLDDHGMSPLTWACKTGREEIAKLLVSKGVVRVTLVPTDVFMCIFTSDTSLLSTGSECTQG